MEEKEKTIPTFEELKDLGYSPRCFNIEYEKKKCRSSVFLDPNDFTYKFVRCTYPSGKRTFNHISIREEIFEDSDGDENNLITDAITQLEKGGCYEGEGIGRYTPVSNCEKCRNISSK